jgi:hypothetical protein
VIRRMDLRECVIVNSAACMVSTRFMVDNQRWNTDDSELHIDLAMTLLEIEIAQSAKREIVVVMCRNS